VAVYKGVLHVSVPTVTAPPPPLEAGEEAAEGGLAEAQPAARPRELPDAKQPEGKPEGRRGLLGRLPRRKAGGGEWEDAFEWGVVL
jgi:hypothetical protein